MKETKLRECGVCRCEEARYGMINMNKKKNKRILTGVIAGILVLTMIIPTVASAIAGWIG